MHFGRFLSTEPGFRRVVGPSLRFRTRGIGGWEGRAVLTAV